MVDTLTYPFCGSCGWDFRENLNDDVFCDACGADLRRFISAGQLPPEDLVATPSETDVSFEFTENPGADTTEYRSITTAAPTWTAWAPAVSPIVIAAPPGDTVCIEVRSVVSGTPGPAAQECATVLQPPPDPPATGATAGAPGTWTPVPSTPPANFAGMAGIVASPLTLWTVGQHMVLDDASEAYWDSLAWQVGQAPA